MVQYQVSGWGGSEGGLAGEGTEEWLAKLVSERRWALRKCGDLRWQVLNCAQLQRLGILLHVGVSI